MNSKTNELLNHAFEFASRHDFSNALKYCDMALEQEPNSALVRYDKGFVLQKLGRDQEALREFFKALELDPEMHKTYRGIAVTYMAMGEHDKARDTLHKWMKAAPDDLTPYQHLAATKKFTHADTKLAEELEEKISKLPKHSKEITEMHFVLGKIYDDMREYDKAFTHYKKGNSLQGGITPFDKKERELEQNLAAQISSFDAEFFKKRKGWGEKSNMPIFIIGMPRSGTTLVEQILASHPKVQGAGELELAQQFADSVQPLLKSNISYPSCILSADKKFIRTLAQEYLKRLTKFASGKERVADKMPHNFWHVGLLHLLLPNAKFILCTRDKMDTALSIYFCKFMYGNEYSYGFPGIAKYYEFHDRMMEHWRKILPENILEIKYEELVSDTEKHSRQLIDFCALEWDEACLSPHMARTSVITASSWQARQPVYKTSVAKWKNYDKYLSELKRLLSQ